MGDVHPSEVKVQLLEALAARYPGGVPARGVSLWTRRAGVGIFDHGHAGTLGEHEALLDDLFDVGLQGSTQEVVVAGLGAGCYGIYTYAWAPDHPGFLTTIWVPGALSGTQTIGGEWTGKHARGTTFARHIGTAPPLLQQCLRERDCLSCEIVAVRIAEPGDAKSPQRGFCPQRAQRIVLRGADSTEELPCRPR